MHAHMHATVANWYVPFSLMQAARAYAGRFRRWREARRERPSADFWNWPD
jgi:hypothetical protein